MGDPRLLVGSRVHARVKHIRSAFTCALLLGSRADEAMANGVVLEVTRSKIGGRASTTITVRFECLGKTAVKTLGLRSIRAGDAPDLPRPPPSTAIPPPLDSSVDGHSTPTQPPPTTPLTTAPTDSARDLSRDDMAEPATRPCHSAAERPVAVGGGPALLLRAAESTRGPPTPPVGTPVSLPSAGGSPPAPPPVSAGQFTSGLASQTAASPTLAHGFEWRDQQVLQPIGGPVPRKPWSVRALGGDIISEGGDAVGFGRTRTPLDYFFAVFPQDQLTRVTELTSAKLESRRLPPTSPGEILKFFGILILATRFQFGSRADLWATAPRSKHMPAPAFGARTGMPRHRFDALWSALTFSRQPAGGGPANGQSGGERYRWALINDFISSINAHREAHVTPGDTICVDESMIKWYGLGGPWISVGLPMYVAIDRKPENGCEIQNAACGRSGIMLRLHLVTTAADQHANMSAEESQVLHGTAVLQRLVGPWAGSDRIVCADSYFSSVEAALALKGMGLRLIGVVKTAHRRFPMASLAARELRARGSWVSMVHTDTSGAPDLMAAMWADRNRRFFVATAGSARPGAPCERLRWRQLDGGAERVAVSVPQPEVAEIYYGCCAQIDRHNRCRQDDLRLEHKLGTHDWSQRVNISLLGVCIVDAWLLHSGARGPASLKQAAFYEDLASGLIDNTFDSTGARPRAATGDTNPTPPLGYGVGVHLTPTTKRRHPSAGGAGVFLAQRRCCVCTTHTSTLVCSECRQPDGGREMFVCGAKTGRNCFASHVLSAHDAVL